MDMQTFVWCVSY